MPPGFTVERLHTLSGFVRRLALSPAGDLFATDSAGRILLLDDTNGDGRLDETVFASGYPKAFGIAFDHAGSLYLGLESALLRFAWRPGLRRAIGFPEHVAAFPVGNHWTREVVFDAERRRVFVGVGSFEYFGPEPDEQRGTVLRIDPRTGVSEIFGSGLRNPSGLAVHPTTGMLYAVVNERDGLGDELVPDYLTSVREGQFFGWPYTYFGANLDPRIPDSPAVRQAAARAAVPDLSLGAHVAPMGIAFYTGTQFPEEYRYDAFVSLHGSLNRTHSVGDKVVRVRFREGRPTAEVTPFLWGFYDQARNVRAGRVAGLLVDRDGALLICDDAARVVWRVTYGAARPRDNRPVVSIAPSETPAAPPTL